MYRLFPLPYLDDACPYFAAIRQHNAPVFLDSGKPRSGFGRYDIIAASPVAELSYQHGITTLTNTSDTESLSGNPFSHLQAMYQASAENCPPPADKAISQLPFCGGMIGYFSYDLGRSLEELPELNPQDQELPDMQAAIYPWAVIVDHQEKRTQLVTTPLMDQPSAEALKTQIETALKAPQATGEFTLTNRFSSNLTEQDYYDALDKVSDYIQAGDCYQVNFAQRFKAGYEGDTWQAYLKLRAKAPTPYSAYIETPQGSILSLSPEQFLEVDNGKVTTKPIKGTRPRGKTPEDDQNLAQELFDSEKDRAENLMIVDLLRNDISKVCQHGTVRVPKLFDIESYANVHHLVSTVTGMLDTDKTPLDLLEHSFPGGSITGAPKIRAMEIIEELEHNRRSIYCGSIGYLSFSGRFDSSITIRTLLCHDNQIHCWAGGGIVADSETADEYQETYNKVNNLLQALEDGLH